MDRRHKEIADFLRSRRARLKPRDAGLRSGMRRRTPGLRREEVAELAGIGAGWYTFLEQGRDVRPSEAALRRIAKALRLDPVEEKYLLKLALQPPRPTRHGVAPAELADVIQSIASPAFVMGPDWDGLSCNEAASAVLDAPQLPDSNMLRLTFTPEFRVFVTNWEQRAQMIVAAFRAQSAASLSDPKIAALVDDLEKRCPPFREWWAEQTVAQETSGRWACDHPFVGRLQFNSVIFGVLDSPGLSLDICVCEGEESQRRVVELTRQLRNGEHSQAHNLWTALRVRLHENAQYGHAVRV
jgi:transcriptional regulator with XRE-family HTH domain